MQHCCVWVHVALCEQMGCSAECFESSSGTTGQCCAGSALVKLAIAEMIKGECEEVVLEAEVTNSGALALYQNLGFIRDKHLHR